MIGAGQIWCCVIVLAVEVFKLMALDYKHKVSSWPEANVRYRRA